MTAGGHHLPGPAVGTVALLVCVVCGLYLLGVLRLRRRGISWPPGRAVSWILGAGTVGVALAGPIAQRAHHDFAGHMLVHVLLGMLGPLLMVLGSPVALALRVLPVRAARAVSRVLGSAPAAVLTNPVVAGLLNIGGLWVLYRTGLYQAMHTDPAVHALVHAHVFAAGYLFSFAVLGRPDPAPHRPAPHWRAAALVGAIAAHNVLAKSLYADPPAGVPPEQAQAGAQLMYYAGAPVELLLIVLLCRSWLLPRRDRGRRAPLPA
ncbi:cytochrome c oxidase assembly protein [Pseudonocardia parietis]|uniref:Membrane protein n=1 Tax=Pseudonocardia parietis TaxID=570936 RepID=A0ABS4VT63_9PSEU|nr:cytochrome c oxidase assembly protein [Pseudonocardia parietis]MBP2367123.1 putative membrane protein [Pseudonocardia parietis]